MRQYSNRVMKYSMLLVESPMRLQLPFMIYLIVAAVSITYCYYNEKVPFRANSSMKQWSEALVTGHILGSWKG